MSSIYYVIGSMCPSDIKEQAEPFGVNVCASSKEEARAIATERFKSEGFRGIVTTSTECIARNYSANDAGFWYFQNGPQRVYLELEATPLVWRVSANAVIHAHTGALAQFKKCFVDERGWVYLQTDLGFGLVHTQDTIHVAKAIETQHWPVEEVNLSELPKRFGYQTSPVRALKIT